MLGDKSARKKKLFSSNPDKATQVLWGIVEINYQHYNVICFSGTHIPDGTMPILRASDNSPRPEFLVDANMHAPQSPVQLFNVHTHERDILLKGVYENWNSDKREGYEILKWVHGIFYRQLLHIHMYI